MSGESGNRWDRHFNLAAVLDEELGYLGRRKLGDDTVQQESAFGHSRVPEKDVRKHLGRVDGLSHAIKVLDPHPVRVEAAADAVTPAPTSESTIVRIPEAGAILPGLAHSVPVMIAGLCAHLVRVRVRVPGGRSATRLGGHTDKRTGLTKRPPPHSTRPQCLLRRTGRAPT